MTLLDYEELCGYWADHPPVHLSVAAYLGIGRRPGGATRPSSSPHSSSSPSSPSTNSGLHELLASQGFAKGNLHDGCAEGVVLDFAGMVARAKARKAG